MTQAPATPELVERLNEHVRYEYMPTAARLAMEEAAAALEAQQARIAELEAESAALTKALRPFAEVARHDIGEDEADADLFKPMSERNARAPLLKVGDLRRAAFSIDDAAAENGQDGEPDEVLVDVAASLAAAISLLERGGRKASPSDKMFEHMLSDYRGSLSRARQALSSQGRREGGEG